MSMFILSTRHYQSVKEYWIGDILGQGDKKIGLRYWLENFYPIRNEKGSLDNGKCYAALDSCFDYLLHMNIETWNSKYNESAELYKLRDVGGSHKRLRAMECLSAMNSISYQIETEHIDMTPTKKRVLELLEYAIGQLANRMLSATPEYEQAGCWSIENKKVIA